MVDVELVMDESRKTTGNTKIVTQARLCLEQNEIFRGRAELLRIDEQDGRLMIHGHLPSFYLKQLLQTTLRDIDGVTEIDNHVDVMWPQD